MTQKERTFEVVTGPISEATALIIGIAGETGTGKTMSAIRLALGMCRVVGGQPCLIDTNSRRGLHYRKPRGPYEYDYIDFSPPFAPLDYVAAIQQAVDRGNKVIIVDSMSDEHSGEGGIMDQINHFLDDKCGDDWNKREKMNMVAHARIKPPQRGVLNRYILQLGRTGVIPILCYRAHDKVKPVTGAGIKHVGFEPETTSTLRFEMTQAFLLMPGSKGKPTVSPETFDEQIWSKTPMQFENWMKGEQLDEDMGERLARWAKDGGGPPVAVPTQASATAGTYSDKFKAFLVEMAALKARNQEVYYRVLGANGYEHANQLTKQGIASRIKEEIEAAIKDAGEKPSVQQVIEPGWNG